MPVDIIPAIDIPMITVVCDYRGLQAQEMEQRITTFNEFIMSTVNDVKSQRRSAQLQRLPGEECRHYFPINPSAPGTPPTRQVNIGWKDFSDSPS